MIRRDERPYVLPVIREMALLPHFLCCFASSRLTLGIITLYKKAPDKNIPFLLYVFHELLTLVVLMVCLATVSEETLRCSSMRVGSCEGPDEGEKLGDVIYLFIFFIEFPKVRRKDLQLGDEVDPIEVIPTAKKTKSFSCFFNNTYRNCASSDPCRNGCGRCVIGKRSNGGLPITIPNKSHESLIHE